MRYRPTYEVEARQVTADNLEEMAEWAEGWTFEVWSGGVKTGEIHVMVNDAEYTREAEVGDWIIRDPAETQGDEGEFDAWRVVPADAFARLFEAVE